MLQLYFAPLLYTCYSTVIYLKAPQFHALVSTVIFAQEKVLNTIVLYNV